MRFPTSRPTQLTRAHVVAGGALLALLGLLSPLAFASNPVGSAAIVSLAPKPKLVFVPFKLVHLHPPRVYALRLAAEDGGTIENGAVSCAGACETTYDAEASTPLVVLRAVPRPGFSFAGWAGGCAGTTPVCTFMLTADRSVAASFEAQTEPPPPPYVVSVAMISGSGTITSSPGGIRCPPTCSASFPSGRGVTITAAPGHFQTLASWAGVDCSQEEGGRSSCSFFVPDHDVAVTAAYEVRTALSISLNGNGVVVASPPGTDPSTGEPTDGVCRPGAAACRADHEPGEVVTLRATPGAGTRFVGWGSWYCPPGNECRVRVDSFRPVTANFSPLQLNVEISGNGSVASAGGSVSCPGRCSTQAFLGARVFLRAEPQAGERFLAWRHCDPLPGNPLICEAGMAFPRSVHAQFTTGGVGATALALELAGSLPLRISLRGIRGRIEYSSAGQPDRMCTRAKQPCMSEGYAQGQEVRMKAVGKFRRWQPNACLDDPSGKKPVCRFRVGVVHEVLGKFR
jgi:uncharacterized repeat protein (TIGR02543 family)